MEKAIKDIEISTPGEAGSQTIYMLLHGDASLPWKSLTAEDRNKYRIAYLTAVDNTCKTGGLELRPRGVEAPIHQGIVTWLEDIMHHCRIIKHSHHVIPKSKLLDIIMQFGKMAERALKDAKRLGPQDESKTIH